MIYQRPKGNVKFAYGRFDDLPYGAEEVKIFMVPGDPVLYVVPVGDIPYAYEKNEPEIPLSDRQCEELLDYFREYV